MKILSVAVLVGVTLTCVQQVCGQEYTLGPDAQQQSGVPKGTVTAYELAPGKFFPGTPHTYSIYVPAQYETAKSAPFMIFLDGGAVLLDSVRVPMVFDNLIARHALPPMIAIFVNPGTLPALTEQSQNRVERIFEYDSLSDRYARFLFEELIPKVGKKYNLSKNPDDRGLCGLSTGAVGEAVGADRRNLWSCGESDGV